MCTQNSEEDMLESVWKGEEIECNNRETWGIYKLMKGKGGRLVYCSETWEI